MNKKLIEKIEKEKAVKKAVSVRKTPRKRALKKSAETAQKSKKTKPLKAQSDSGNVEREADLSTMFFFRQVDLLQMLNFSKQYLSRVLIEKGIEAVDGKYDARRVIPLFIKDHNDNRLLSAKIRTAEATAEMAEIDLAFKRKQAISFEDVSAVVKSVFESFAASIQVFPRKLAMRVVGIDSVEQALDVITIETDKWQSAMLESARKSGLYEVATPAPENEIDSELPPE